MANYRERLSESVLGSRSRRLVLSACALGAVACAFGFAGSLARPAGARAAVAPCKTSGLVVWIDTRGNAAAGSVFYTLKLTNESGRTCTLGGYAGVSAVSLGGRRLGSPAARDRGVTPRVITLRNGATTSAQLRIVQALNFPRTTCRPVMAAGVRVYPPSQTTSKVVPIPFRACSRVGPVYLQVQSFAGTA
jgi:hypothetical protein